MNILTIYFNDGGNKEFSIGCAKHIEFCRGILTITWKDYLSLPKSIYRDIYKLDFN